MSYEHFIPYKGSRCPIQAMSGERVEETTEETLQRVCTKNVREANSQEIPQPIVKYALDWVLDFYNEIK